MGFPGDPDPENTDEDITYEDLDNEDDFEEHADDIDDMDTCPICASRNNHHQDSECEHLIGVQCEGSIEDCHTYDLFVPMFHRLIELGTQMVDDGFEEPFHLALTKKLASLGVQTSEMELFTPPNEETDAAFFALGQIQEGETLSSDGSFSSGSSTNLYSALGYRINERILAFGHMVEDLQAETSAYENNDSKEEIMAPEPRYVKVEQEFGVPPPEFHCPVCGRPAVETADDPAKACAHLVFFYSGLVNEFIYTRPDFDAKAKAYEEDDEVDNLEDYLAKTELGAGFFALEIGYGGMACGPVWFSDIVGFDCSQSGDESKEE
jgi:hypothetical protein